VRGLIKFAFTMNKHHKKFFGALVFVVLATTVLAGTAYAASTISTNISTGGTLTVSGLSLLNGNASTTQLSVTDRIFVGTGGATTIFGNSSTSTFLGGISLGGGGLHLSNGGLRVATLVSCDTVDTNANGVFVCGADATGGGGGTDTNWTYFNNSGLRLSTTTNKVLIGSSSTSTAATLEVQGTQYVSGTLGVATTTPSGVFGVIGNSYLQGAVTVGGAIVLTSGSLTVSSLTNCDSIDTTASGVFVCGTDAAGGGSGTVNSGTIDQFAYYAASGTTVSGTSSVVILPNANVGVGTTTPRYAFSVAGTIYSGSGGIRFPDGSTQTAAAAGAAAGTQGQTAFYNANGSTVSGTSTLTITQAGNVGIGTTSPSAALAVNGSVTVGGNLTLANSSTAVGGIVFGVCSITGATINKGYSKNFSCIASSTISSSYKIFVQSDGSLATDFIIQAASSTGSTVIGMNINNTSTTTSYSPGNLNFNFFGIR